MKRWLQTLGLFAMLLVLAACAEDTQNAQSEPVEEEEKAEETEEQKDSSQESREEEAQTKEEEESTESDKESEEPQQKESLEPMYELTNVWSLKPVGDAEEKAVLLTIDDAPDNYGLEMAKTLKELNAPAIFFVNGHFINSDEEKAALKEIYDMGFEIGNHTYTHAKLDTISQEQQKSEILELNQVIEEVVGEKPKFFRAPHGVNTDYSKSLAAEENMLLMNWSYGYDWNAEYQSEEAIADIMVNTNLLGNGSNLLMHDREWTAKALDDIVKGLRDKGYTLIDPDTIKTPASE
ncbi:polysaccharide deacetylase [Pontibacillus halophilus JSM 076056 = DSM 19796]|uniref:Polysaccharide deacetylase n=1 Tax=Pontibacillus halophilus JSM 076056 = DSM 19796 TaxID=1385510 RepID=A0A0A5GEA6_9BACI|nr:polysaccharide deacetylase family protein [Pontibacillus halophilus]KGX91536.1 polysaccharide deacetylase [Pontibacillus halophilus JSM 076056 = DSM 19796]